MDNKKILVGLTRSEYIAIKIIIIPQKPVFIYFHIIKHFVYYNMPHPIQGFSDKSH